MNLSLTRMFVHEPMERGDVLCKNNEIEKMLCHVATKEMKKTLCQCVIKVVT